MSKDGGGGGRNCAIVLLSIALVGAIAALVPLTLLHFSGDSEQLRCQCPVLRTPEPEPQPAASLEPEPEPAASVEPEPEPTPAGPTTVEAADEGSLASEHQRLKRSASGLLGAMQQMKCQTGFVGAHCQYPVCPARGSFTPTNGMTGFGVPIDIQVKQQCQSLTQTILVDSTHLSLFILVDSEVGANPTIALTAPNGAAVKPIIISSGSTQVAGEVVGPMPGVWQLAYSSAKPCVLFAMGQTKLTVNDGIIAAGAGALQSDSPASVVTEGVPSYVVAHANSLQCPAAINFLEVYEANQLTWSSQANSRFNCSYDTFFGLVDCNYAHAYYYKLFGMDNQGYQFQRTNTLLCRQKGPATTTLPPTPTAGSCFNGGTYLGPGQCVCPPFFSGQYCGQFQCLNGGTLQSSSQCICPTGFTGNHCQTVQCVKPPPNTPPNNFDTTDISLSIVFNIRSSMQTDWQQLFQSALTVIDAFNQNHPGALKSYVLTAFRDNYLNTTTYTSVKSFSTALATLVTQLQTSVNCTQPVVGAIIDNLKHSLPHSPIYVITDALASDYAQIETLQHTDAFWGSELYFILTNRTNTGQSMACPTNAIGAPGLVVYEQLAQYSTGQLISIAKSQLGQLITSFFPTQYGTDVLLTADYYACAAQPTYTTFNVDSTIKTLYIYGGGPGTYPGASQSLVLIAPSGQQMSLQPPVNVGNLYMWTIASPNIGVYQIRYSTAVPSLPCTLRVRGVTKLHMFYSVTSGIAIDHSLPMPTWKQPSNVVVHVSGLQLPPSQLFGGEIAIKSPGGVTKFLSSGQIRQQCDYRMFFAPYTCTTYGQIFYLTFYGRDNNGIAFQRSRAGFCSPSRVTPAPPNDCQNGGYRPHPQAPSCLCPVGWTGQQCTTIYCFNGGTSLGQQCDCAPGWSGPFCRVQNCITTNPNVIQSPNNRSLVFVVQNTPSMQTEIAQIINVIDSFIAQANQDNPSWFMQYGLVTFSDTQYQVAYQGGSQSGFVKAVKALTTGSHSTQCERNVLTATAAGLLLSVPYGTVYVFTDGGANDYHQTANLYGYLEATKAAVTFVVSNPNPCGSNFSTPYTQIYKSLAEYSDGQLFPVEKTMVGPIVQHYLGQLYSTGMVHTTAYSQCTSANPTRIYFPIEYAAQGFLIAATGYMVSITLYDPTGKVWKYANPIVSGGTYVSILHAYHKTGTQGDPFFPGVWSATIGGQVNPAGGFPSCQMWVRAQSPLQVFYGFLQNSRTNKYPTDSDFPTKEPEVARGLYNYMIAHVDGITTGSGHVNAHLDYMNNFDDAGGALVSSATFSRRQGCGYEYISLPWQCNSLYFTSVLSGYDNYGYAFNRLRVAICLPGVPVVTTTPPPPQCTNGGVSANGQCLCPAWWGGNLCQTAICANGGTSTGSGCTCAPNYSGFHCTVSQCSSQQPDNFSPNGRSFAWVVQNTASMYLDVKQMQASVQQVVNGIQQQNASWINQWILITFNESNKTQVVVNSSNPQDFINGVNGLNPLSDLTSKCGKQALHGIYAALQMSSHYGYIYTFTDSSTSDFGFELYILPALEATKAALSFVVTSNAPCGKPLSESSFQLLAAISDGQLFVIQKSEVQQVLMYPEYLYKSSLASQHIVPNCKAGAQGTTIYFPLDYSAFSFTVILSGNNPSLKIYTPSGQLYTQAVPIVQAGSGYTLADHVYKRPGNLGHGVVAGMWKLVVATTPDVSFGPSCIAQVRVQSDIQMYYGFSQDSHSDIPQPEPTLSVTNYMMAQVTGLSPPAGHLPGALEYATLYNETFIQERSFQFKPRQKCSYNWVSQGFTCPRLALGIVASGYDAYGFMFQRIRVAICYPKIAPLICANNGVAAGGKCYCSALFTGPSCGTAICLNGGTSNGGQCSCAPGWSGAHCATAMCAKQNPYAPASFTPNGRSFALVVQDDFYTMYDRQLISENINAMVARVQKVAPQWINKWILVTFNSTGATRNIATSTVGDFVTAVQALKNDGHQGTSVCPKAIAHGLQQALSATSAYGTIWVFTRAVLNDIGLLASDVFNSIEISRAQVSFVVTEVKPCGQAWTQNDTETFLQIASLSDGQVVPVTSQDIPSILTKFIPALYNTGLAFESGQVDCSSQVQYFYFPVDSHATSFILTVSAFNATVVILDPNQRPYTPDSYLADFFVRFYHPKGTPMPGMWTVYVKASSQILGCRVQVRVASDIQLYYGFLQNTTTDFPSKEPVMTLDPSVQNYMAVHASGLTKPGARMGYTQIFHGNGTMTRAASLSRRANCAYDWISQPFTCPNFYFLVQANGIDEAGYPWYRIRTALCIPKIGESPVRRLAGAGLPRSQP